FVENHHLGELSPRAGFIVTTLTGTNRAVVRFYNQRQPATSARAPRYYSGLVVDESPTAVDQDRGTADSARSVFPLAARGKLLDRPPIAADSRAHRAAGAAPDMIGKAGGITQGARPMSPNRKSRIKLFRNTLTALALLYAVVLLGCAPEGTTRILTYHGRLR